MQMLKLRENVKAFVVMGALLAAVSACEQKEGPAERAGKEADKVVSDVGKSIEKAGENIQDAAKGDKK
jgi:hypothetical protein